MFNSGFRGRRENDGQGSINPQAQYVQNKYPQPYISGWSISGTDDTSLNPAGGQTVLVNGSGFATGISATLGGSQIGSVTLVNPTQISFTAPANAGGSYTLIVYNSTGGAAILVPGLTYSSVPTWTTAAGSIGSYYETTAINSNVVATSDSALTYTLSSGSLPAGATLYANGVITGTAPVDSGSTTYTFNITATDAELQDTTRTFTLTINVDVVTWVSPANNTTYTQQSNVAISNVSLSATDAAGYGIVYSANTLPTGISIVGSVITGTPTVGANTSTLLTATANTTGRTATNTINWVVTLSDPYWNLTTLALNSLPTTTPFQSDASLNNASIAPVGDTRASPYNPYQTGYYSNYFDGTGDYLSTTVTNQAPGTGNFTYECWFYVTSLAAVRTIMNTRSGDTTDGFDLSVNTSGAIVATYTATGLYTSSAGIVTINTWYHLAVVRTLGTTITVYLNGTSRGNFTAGGSTNFTSTTLYVGAGALAVTPMLGYISNFRYTRYAVYNTAFTPGTVPLVPLAGTALLTAQSQRLIDTSPYNFAITKNGDTTAVPANPFATVYDYGTPYYSTYFDGTSDWLTTTLTGQTLGSGDFTIEFWMYQQINETHIFTYGTSWGDATGVQMIYYSGSTNYAVSVGGTSNNYFGNILRDQWVHVAIVRSSGTVKVYFNGIASATTLSTTTNLTATALNIGYASTGNWASYAGCISNFRMVSGTAIYTTNFVPPTSSLTAVAGTRILTCQNSTLIDNSANAFAITSNGDARPVPQSPLYSAYYSNYFDGTGDYLSTAVTGQAPGTGNFTYECWFYVSSLAATRAILNTRSGDTTDGFNAYVTTAGAIEFTYTATALFTSSNGVVVVGQWYHFAVVRTSTSVVTVYLNGASLGNWTAGASSNFTSTTMYIGASALAATPMLGYISNFRYTKGQALYTTTFTPSTSPLTTTSQGATAANVALLTCQSLYFIDNSTNVFAITANGDTKIVTLAPFTQPSQYGATTTVATYGSGYFDGTGDYLSLPSSLALTLTGNFTIEFWIYCNGTYNNQGILGGAAATTGIYTDSSGYFQIDANNANFAYNSDSTRILDINQWTHVAISRSGSTMYLFKNGVSRTLSLVGSPGSTTYNFTAGTPGQSQSPAKNANGWISNLRIVNGTALYTANFQPSPTPLTAVTNTQLLTLQYNGGSNDSQFRDGSNFQNLITRGGNATQGTFTPFSATGWSGYFDGTGDYLTASTSAVTLGTGDYTIEFWMNTTQADAAIIDTRASGSTTGWLLSAYTSYTINLTLNGTSILTSSNAFTPGTWNHIAVVRSSSVMKIYINGTNTNNVSNSSNWAPQNFNIGQKSWTSSGVPNFNGWLSNLRIVIGQAIYTANFTPSTTPLTTTSQSATAGNVSFLTLQSPSFIDNSANRFTITVAGDTKTQSFSPFSGVTTTQYYSGYFDGSGDYLSLATNAAFNFSTGDFTVEAWVYPTSLATDWFVISATGSGGLCVGYAGGIGFGWGRTAVAWDYRPGTLTANAWQHVAVTRSGTSMYVFVNGTQAGTTQTLSTAYNLGATATTVGSQGANYYLNGYISNLRVVKGQALYTANFTPATSPLTTTSQSATAANVSLLTCQSSTFIDNSTNAFAITVNGDSIPTTFAPFAATSTTGISYTTSVNGGSMYFDGSGDYLSLPTGLVNFLSQGISSWTIEFWSYHRSTSAMCVLATASGSSQVGIMITLNYSSLSEIDMEIFRGSSGNFYTVKTGSVLTTNAWNHIAITWDGSSTFKMYVNGISRTITTTGTRTFSSAAATAQPTVGTYGAGNYFSGWMSNFRILAGTVAYTSSFSPPTAPPVPTAATTVLLNSTNGSIIDYTGKNDLETVADARLAPQNPYGGSYYSNYFDGTGDYLSVPDSTVFTIGTNNFTIEAWICPLATPSSGSIALIACQYIDTGSRAFMFAMYNNSGTMQLLFQPYSSSTQTIISQNCTFNLGEWIHVAAVRSSNNVTLYRNGVSLGTTAYSSSIDNASGAYLIGARFNASSVAELFFNGYISNHRFTNGQALYTTTFTPATSPLTTTSQGATAANVSLLTCQSSTFIDNSTNAFTVTQFGDTAVNSVNPFQNNGTYSMYFDGTGDYLYAASSPNVAFGTGDFTVEFWVYPTVNARQDWIDCNSASPRFLIYYDGTNIIYYSTSARITGGGITLNAWQYITLCRASGSTKLFINGTQSGSTYADTINYGASALNIGRDSAGSTYITGYMTDLRISKYARYTTAFTPPTSTFQTK